MKYDNLSDIKITFETKNRWDFVTTANFLTCLSGRADIMHEALVDVVLQTGDIHTNLRCWWQGFRPVAAQKLPHVLLRCQR